MTINYEQPMTVYELIAIILSVLALIIPAIKWGYDKFFKRLKIDSLPSGMITLFHNKSGSYISLGGVYEAQNKATTIKEISAKVIRKSDNATLSLMWSTFPSPVYRGVAGNYESSFETAHPFKVEADTLVPAFVEFANMESNMDETTNNILRPVENASLPILSQGNIALLAADSGVKASPEYNAAKLSLNDYFFWKKGTYEVILTTVHSKGSFDKKYEVRLSKEESDMIRQNIDNLLVLHVAKHFRLTLPMNSIRKEFKEKKK